MGWLVYESTNFIAADTHNLSVVIRVKLSILLFVAQFIPKTQIN